MTLQNEIKIVEVGPRDGLQNEARSLSAEKRAQFIQSLASCGLKHIEAGSFVRSDKVPQMADTATVYELLADTFESDITLPALVPNMHGFEQATKSKVREIAVFASATEAFSQKNIGCSIDESIDRFEQVAAQALANGMRVRGYVSCVLGCPYEGNVPLENVVSVVERLLSIECYEISLGDTIGSGTPSRTKQLLSELQSIAPIDRFAMHCHDTYGMAIANLYTALECGIRVIDSAVAGLGGCPYARGASGNVATEDVIYLLDGLNLQHGVDLEQLILVGRSICEALDRPVMSKVNNARQF